MLSVTFLLVVASGISTLVSAIFGKNTLWIAVLLLVIVHLLGVLPR